MTAEVLYIAGFGRSGSTLLGNVLGAYDGVFSTGELHLLWQALIRDTGCGCGARVAGCEVWSRVLDDLRTSGAWDGDPQTVRRWQLAEARVAHTRRILRVTQAEGTAPSTRPDLDRYRALLGALYEAIARVTGAGAIVESSKTPADAAALLGVEGIHPRLVHLVRDPRAVAFSQGRRKPTLDPHRGDESMHRRGVIESSARWVSVNLLTERVRRRYGEGRWAFLPYERFAAEPQGAAEALLRLAGGPTGQAPFTAPRVVHLGANHNVWGNRSRFATGPTEIRADEAWREGFPARDRRIVTALCLPWLGRYGYPSRSGSAPSAAAGEGS
jgi:hypothetical protein